jgi:hypothetical protein
MTDNITEKDREFLENLDRILTGRESEITGPLDDDTRTALNFARKMASLREAPSKEFAENLKAQLVHRLAEQEKKDSPVNQTLMFWGVPRRKLWQGTIAAAIVVIVIAIVLLIILLSNQSG